MTDDRQDRNGVRTPVDVERRHKLGLIEKTAKEVGEIKEIDANFSSTSTRALQNKIITTTINRLFNEKVDKVSGMTLSHNDYTDNDKYKVNNLDGHVHNNINILNSITSQDIDNWNATSFESYSTSEEVIGEWIDGKPLYRQVLDVTLTPNSTNNFTVTNSSDFEIVTKVDGMMRITRPNGWVPVNFYNDNQHNFAFFNIDNNRIEVGNSWYANRAIIVIEYTKTTD